MNKRELIDSVSVLADISVPEAARTLDALTSVVHAALVQGKEVKLPNLGKLSTRERAARSGRNPRTGEPAEIPAKTVVSFKPSKALTDAVTS